MGEPQHVPGEPCDCGPVCNWDTPMTTPTAPLTAESEAVLARDQHCNIRKELEAIEAAVRAEADVLRAAIPEDPWYPTSLTTARCFWCHAQQFFSDHAPDCAWLAARAAMQK